MFFMKGWMLVWFCLIFYIVFIFVIMEKFFEFVSMMVVILVLV